MKMDAGAWFHTRNPAQAAANGTRIGHVAGVTSPSATIAATSATLPMSPSMPSMKLTAFTSAVRPIVVMTKAGIPPSDQAAVADPDR